MIDIFLGKQPHAQLRCKVRKKNRGQVASNPTFDTRYDLLNSGVGMLGLPGATGSVFMTIYKDTYKRCANGTASDFDWYNMTNCSGNGFYSISMYMRFK